MKPATDGHLNFFEDLEHNVIATTIRTAKKTEPVETERGVLLAPSAKDLRPWYTESRTAKPDEAEADEKRKRDTTNKSTQAHVFPASAAECEVNAQTNTNTAQPEVQARPTRESPERACTMELIRWKQREMRWSETPSSVHGGRGGGCGDVFNRHKVEEAPRAGEAGSQADTVVARKGSRPCLGVDVAYVSCSRSAGATNSRTEVNGQASVLSVSSHVYFTLNDEISFYLKARDRSPPANSKSSGIAVRSDSQIRNFDGAESRVGLPSTIGMTAHPEPHRVFSRHVSSEPTIAHMLVLTSHPQSTCTRSDGSTTGSRQYQSKTYSRFGSGFWACFLSLKSTTHW
ncbi:hypothetical protein K438DRAFT_1933089 [Mycena galopus ATCC 62051]|nr:hypothetical protein K438DRAFT_1933089 [Mycena galopus ATCC 62051]